MSTCETTVDLSPFYLPRHYAPPAAPSGFDWNAPRVRVLKAVARLVGDLLLDAAIVVGSLVVLLVGGSAVVDYWIGRH